MPDLTIGWSDRGPRLRWDKAGVDDRDKVPSLDAGEAPRRSTSSLDEEVQWHLSCRCFSHFFLAFSTPSSCLLQLFQMARAAKVPPGGFYCTTFLYTGS